MHVHAYNRLNNKTVAIEHFREKIGKNYLYMAALYHNAGRERDIRIGKREIYMSENRD